MITKMMDEFNGKYMEFYVVDNKEYEVFVSAGFSPIKYNVSLREYSDLITFLTMEDSNKWLHTLILDILEPETIKDFNYEVTNILLCIMFTMGIKYEYDKEETLMIATEVFETLDKEYLTVLENPLFSSKNYDKYKNSFIVSLMSYVNSFSKWLTTSIDGFKYLFVSNGIISENDTLMCFDYITIGRGDMDFDLSEIIENTSIKSFYSYSGIDKRNDVLLQNKYDMTMVLTLYTRNNFKGVNNE